MDKGNKLTYQSAFEELKQIVRAMEEGDISVDELAPQVKRATQLIEICRTKLEGTEKEVQHILEKMSPQPPEASES